MDRTKKYFHAYNTTAMLMLSILGPPQENNMPVFDITFEDAIAIHFSPF
jgi:hypothetical protein